MAWTIKDCLKVLLCPHKNCFFQEGGDHCIVYQSEVMPVVCLSEMMPIICLSEVMLIICLSEMMPINCLSK